MEINITSLMARAEDMIYYSASVAEIGQDAGRVTWENALDAVETAPLVPPEGEAEARDYFREFGAWEDEEIDGWSAQELNALVLQYIAGDIRTRQHYADRGELAKYEENEGGRIYAAGEEWWYYLGN